MVCLPVSTTYSVIITDAMGCTASSTITLSVNPLPVVTLQLPQSRFCIYDPAYFLTGGLPQGGIYSGAAVQWNHFDPSMHGIGSGTITYAFSDVNGCRGTASAVVTVYPKPAVSISPDRKICLGQIVTLTASGGTYYQWAGGQVGASLPVSPFINTTYTVAVTDANGCINVATSTVTVDRACVPDNGGGALPD
jgi:hypothetical protein